MSNCPCDDVFSFSIYPSLQLSHFNTFAIFLPASGFSAMTSTFPILHLPNPYYLLLIIGFAFSQLFSASHKFLISLFQISRSFSSVFFRVRYIDYFPHNIGFFQIALHLQKNTLSSLTPTSFIMFLTSSSNSGSV